MKYINKNDEIVDKKDILDDTLRKLYSTSIGTAFVSIFTNKIFSDIAGKILTTRYSSKIIPKFVDMNDINMNEYEEKEYNSYNDFFTRRIKKGYREFSDNRTNLCSPCDGKIKIYDIDKDNIFKIKNSYYTVKSLLKNDKIADKFIGGKLAVIRLSVDNYHRYSYVDNGIKSNNYRIKGRYYSVSPAVLDKIKVFKENTREFTVIRTENFGTIIQMEVGATLVGKITNFHQKGKVKRGEEKGYFEFGGSTIILMFTKDKVKFLDKYLNSEYEYEVNMGDIIGNSL